MVWQYLYFGHFESWWSISVIDINDPGLTQMMRRIWLKASLIQLRFIFLPKILRRRRWVLDNLVQSYRWFGEIFGFLDFNEVDISPANTSIFWFLLFESQSLRRLLANNFRREVRTNFIIHRHVISGMTLHRRMASTWWCIYSKHSYYRDRTLINL